MKAVTEFASFTITKAIQTKTQLTGEGKSPEEVQAGLGEAFKLEGEKLGYFVQALDVVGTNTEGLKRVVVMRLNEGEKPPAKATQVEDLVYVPEFHVDPKVRAAAMKAAADKKGKGGGRGGDRNGGGKESPWGLSPEQKAAKNKPAAKA